MRTVGRGFWGVGVLVMYRESKHYVSLIRFPTVLGFTSGVRINRSLGNT